MNLVLLLVCIAEICLVACVWLTPECLRWVAAHFLTRADVIEAAKKENHRRLQFWRAELGLVNETHADHQVNPVAQPAIRR